MVSFDDGTRNSLLVYPTALFDHWPLVRAIKQQIREKTSEIQETYLVKTDGGRTFFSDGGVLAKSMSRSNFVFYPGSIDLFATNNQARPSALMEGGSLHDIVANLPLPDEFHLSEVHREAKNFLNNFATIIACRSLFVEPEKLRRLLNADVIELIDWVKNRGYETALIATVSAHSEPKLYELAKVLGIVNKFSLILAAFDTPGAESVEMQAFRKLKGKKPVLIYGPNESLSRLRNTFPNIAM